MRIIAGQFRGRTIQVPKGPGVRPTTGQLREALFNILRDIIEGASLLDLFAGSGAIGLEALSRGANDVTFVESYRGSLDAIHENVRSLGVENQATILGGDVMRHLPRLSKQKRQYTIIYADPPYEHHMSQQILEFLDSSELLVPGGLFCMEESVRGAPVSGHLTHLELIDRRRYGRSTLQLWRRQP